MDSRCRQFILLCTLLLCTWAHWVMNIFILTPPPPSPHSGITHIGGICNPVRSCAVVKDTGLSTVFTVAHELGHSLGLHHDGDQPNGCASGYHIMAPSFSSSSNPHFWSHCSKKHLQEFLRYGDWAGKVFQLLNCVNHFRSEGSSCLNDEPNTTVAPPPAHPPLPGMEYTLDEQCRLLFGAGASHCNTTSRLVSRGGVYSWVTMSTDLLVHVILSLSCRTSVGDCGVPLTLPLGVSLSTLHHLPEHPVS